MKSNVSPDRPSLKSARPRDWKVWFFQEWGLLLLAGVLAILIWEITSRRVVKSHVLGPVEMRIEVDEALQGRVGAVLTGNRTRSFELVCSEREMFEAREALDHDGRAVVVVKVTDADVSKPRDITRNDQYAWPFADHERILPGGLALPPSGGKVFPLTAASPRVAWREDDDATRPTKSELLARQIGISWTLSQPTVALLAPEGSEKQPRWIFLEPDPINLMTVVGKAAGDIEPKDIPFDRPLPYKLTFNNWRERGGEKWQIAWRQGLTLPEITATLTLTQNGERPLTNRLLVNLPDEYEADPPRDSVPGINAISMQLEGTIKGPKAVLDALQGDPSGWAWVIEVIDASQLKEGTMGTQPTPWQKLQARIDFSPTKAEFRNKGITFVPADGQDRFDLKVRWNPRAK